MVLCGLCCLGSGESVRGAVVRPQPPADNPRWPGELRIVVQDPWGQDRAGYVTGGVPLPRGAYRDGAEFDLRAPLTGARVPLQASPLVRWPDGSIKWLLMTFVGDSRPGDNTFLLTGGGNRPEPGSPIRVTRKGGGAVVVDTGPLQLWLREGQAGLWDRLSWTPEAGSSPSLTVPPPRLSIRTTDGRQQAVLPVESRFAIEEAGPLRAVLRVERAGPIEEGAIDYQVRMYCYAGQPWLRIDLTLTNCSDPGSLQAEPGPALSPERGIREVTGLPLSFRLPEGLPAEAMIGREGQPPLACDPASVMLLQDTDQHYTVLQAGEVREVGERAAGWMRVGPVALGCREFWQQFPKSLSFDATTGQLALDLCPADSEAPWRWYPGAAKTHQLVLSFGAGAGRDLVLRPLVAGLPPAELRASAAVPLFGDVDPDSWPQLEHLIGDSHHGWLRFAANGKSPGVGNYGDPGGNGYHGQDYDLLLHYFRTADPTLLRIAAAAALHRADLDIMHYPEQFYRGKHCHGYTTYHWDPSHRRIANIMNWTSGLYYYYCLTGDRRAADVLDEVGDWLAANRVRYPSRECYLPLGWMSEIAEVTGKPAHEDAVGYLYRYLRDTIPYPGDGVQPMPFMAGGFGSGMLGDSLFRYWSATHDESVVPVAARLCRWVYEDYGTASGAIRYHHDPTQGLAIDYYNHGETTALAGVAYTLTGDRADLEYGLGRLEYYLHYSPFSWPLGMSSGLHQLQWACQQAGISEADLGREPRGGFEEALAELNGILDISQGLEDEYFRTVNLGSVTIELVRTLTNAGRYDEALTALEEQLGHVQRSQGWWLERHNARAWVYWRKGDYEAAEQAYRDFLEGLGAVSSPAQAISIPHVHCWWHIAQCAEKRGDWEAAREAYRECSRYTWSLRGRRAAVRLTELAQRRQ